MRRVQQKELSLPELRIRGAKWAKTSFKSSYINRYRDFLYVVNSTTKTPIFE